MNTELEKNHSSHPSSAPDICSVLKKLNVKPFAGVALTKRYISHYGWLHIAHSSEVSFFIGHDTSEFKKALSWYASYRYLYGNHNAYLDKLIDAGDVQWEYVTNDEYLNYYREYIIKGISWFGWDNL